MTAQLNPPGDIVATATTSAARCSDPPLLGGRYRVGSLLGQGGMAYVMLGYDELLGRNVAIKIFRPGSDLPADEDRFDQEARVLAGLSHPNLVTVFDAGLDDNEPHSCRPYLVMEYVAGPTVSDLIASGPAEPGQVAALGAQVAAALDCVHRHGVVHRDVKPGNILLTGASDEAPRDDRERSGRKVLSAKLTDFGIARVIDSAPLTVPGLTIGTATYLSPEQARGEPAGPASDVYSLALVLLELATGHRAFDGVAPEVAFARLHRRPEIPKTIGSKLSDLLRAMTADDPRQRPSAHEVWASLQDEASDELSMGSSPRLTRVAWAVGALAAAVVATVAIAVGFADSGQASGVQSAPSITPTAVGGSDHGLASPSTRPAVSPSQLRGSPRAASTEPARASRAAGVPPAASPAAAAPRPAHGQGHGKHKPRH